MLNNLNELKDRFLVAVLMLVTIASLGLLVLSAFIQLPEALLVDAKRYLSECMALALLTGAPKDE